MKIYVKYKSQITHYSKAMSNVKALKESISQKQYAFLIGAPYRTPVMTVE